MADINESLREHVTRIGFNLSLGKTHIAALVSIDNLLKRNVSTIEELNSGGYKLNMRMPRVFNLFVSGQRGLVERGLVSYIADQRRKPGENISSMRPRRIWRITPAGRLVIMLLKEAGIYQEYVAMMPARERAS